MKPVALAILAGVLACPLAACSNGGPATYGPLSGGAPGGSAVCLPARVGRPLAFGFDTFRNHGHVTAVLDRVALLRPHNERLIGSYAVPGIYIIGAVNWPPDYPHLPPTWKDRRPVHGFRLAPGKSFNMVLGVVAAARGRATSEGMKVYYHDAAGSSYFTIDHDQMIINLTGRPC